jgi:hypothetical protein
LCGEYADTNREGVANFLLVGKAAENFFGSMTHHYVYDRGFKDPSTINYPFDGNQAHQNLDFSAEIWFIQSN